MVDELFVGTTASTHELTSGYGLMMLNRCMVHLGIPFGKGCGTFHYDWGLLMFNSNGWLINLVSLFVVMPEHHWLLLVGRGQARVDPERDVLTVSDTASQGCLHIVNVWLDVLLMSSCVPTSLVVSIILLWLLLIWRDVNVEASIVSTRCCQRILLRRDLFLELFVVLEPCLLYRPTYLLLLHCGCSWFASVILHLS